MSKNDELKRLAEAATAGPWSMCGEADGSQGFEIIQDIWNEHGTHTGKDVVVYEWSDESDPLGVIHRADAEFIAAANPVAVLALIADSNRLESEAVYAAAGFNAAREEIAKIHAEVAGLRTGYEAYERVNAELKAEVEGLRKLGPSKEIIWCACGDGYPVNSYGAGFMAANGDVCENCDAANGRVEPHLDTPDELKALRQALTDIFNHVEGNTECLVRDLVNWGTPRINPNDFYDECEAIKEIANAALGKGDQS